jgi:tetratricopeptide (TPR) repeat protein
VFAVYRAGRTPLEAFNPRRREDADGRPDRGVAARIARAAAAGSNSNDGEALFQECEFKAAAHVFEHAVANDPGNPQLHFRLGKSYARMAEVSSLLSTRKNARKAQAHLETAVRLEPGNREFLIELFELYVDSPEYFDGGLNRAATLLERLGPDDGGPGTPSRFLTDARKQYSGPAWALAKCVRRTSAVAGYVTPFGR